MISAEGVQGTHIAWPSVHMSHTPFFSLFSGKYFHLPLFRLLTFNSALIISIARNRPTPHSVIYQDYMCNNSIIGDQH